MFYRIVALALVVVGLGHIIFSLTWPIDITPDTLEKSAIGLATVFLGLLNFAYVYETPHSTIPKIILFSANLIFIGFAILIISISINPTFGYLTLVLSLVNSVMVLNHKV